MYHKHGWGGCEDKYLGKKTLLKKRCFETQVQQHGQSEGEEKLTILLGAVITTGSLQDVTVVSASVSLQESGTSST